MNVGMVRSMIARFRIRRVVMRWRVFRGREVRNLGVGKGMVADDEGMV